MPTSAKSDWTNNTSICIIYIYGYICVCLFYIYANIVFMPDGWESSWSSPSPSPSHPKKCLFQASSERVARPTQKQQNGNVPVTTQIQNAAQAQFVGAERLRTSLVPSLLAKLKFPPLLLSVPPLFGFLQLRFILVPVGPPQMAEFHEKNTTCSRVCPVTATPHPRFESGVWSERTQPDALTIAMRLNPEPRDGIFQERILAV